MASKKTKKTKLPETVYVVASEFGDLSVHTELNELRWVDDGKTAIGVYTLGERGTLVVKAPEIEFE